MDDRFHELEKLAATARKEAGPRVEVAERVAQAIHARAKEENEFSLNWVAVVSAAAAVVALLALVPIYQVWSDPVISLTLDLSWGLL